MSLAKVLSELSGEPPPDPDAHATLTDFIDYTDFFPSDLKRSLTLIGQLDKTAQQDYDSVHRLTKTYGALPTFPPEERPDPETLRKDISISLDHALRARESSYAEASRLCIVANSLYTKLVSIQKKLVALPKPPSRDPSPTAQPRSPLVTRGRRAEHERAPRITLFSDGIKASARPKQHSRRIIVPGEVLPPFDPLSPGAIYSDSESERAPSPVMIEKPVREKVPKPTKPVIMRIPKVAKIPSAITHGLPRPPGVMGTNVHSTVAGISVSNAMALLEPPPSDPQPGTRHAPWLVLTEWELNKLRKRMKKNANWMPSYTMIRRELTASGRGADNFNKAKARAELTGEVVPDEPPAKTIIPLVRMEDVVVGTTEEYMSSPDAKHNEAKKAKKEIPAQDQAARVAAEIEEASRRITDAGRAVEDLFSANTSTLMIDPLLLLSPPGPLELVKSGKKRKRNAEPPVDGEQNMSASPKTTQDGASKAKKIKLVAQATSEEVESTIVLDLPSLDQIVQPMSHREATPSPAPSLHSTPLILPLETTKFALDDDPDTTKLSSRTAHASPSKVFPTDAKPPPRLNNKPSQSIQAQSRTRRVAPAISLTLSSPTKAASAEPPIRRISLRRTSNASTPGAKAAKNKNIEEEDVPSTRASNRRGKRPTPGLVMSHKEDGGAKVSVGARRTAPRRAIKPTTAAIGSKRSITATATRSSMTTTPEVFENIDPNEELYCVCLDVSYGIMVECARAAKEFQDCERQWFHLACVELTEIPPRRQTWYCPDCRVRLGVSQSGDKL